MGNTETMTKTAHEAFTEMVELTRETHWGKGHLMCTVNVLDGNNRPVLDHWETVSWRDQPFPIYQTKATYCIMGLAIKVGVEAPVWSESTDLYSSSWPKAGVFTHTPTSPLVEELVNVMYEQLKEWYPSHWEEGEADVMFGHRVGRIESWNDAGETTRGDILTLLEKCAENTKPKETV